MKVTLCRILPVSLIGLCLFGSSARADTVELDLSSGGSTTVVIVGAPCGAETCVSFSGTVGG